MVSDQSDKYLIKLIYVPIQRDWEEGDVQLSNLPVITYVRVPIECSTDDVIAMIGNRSIDAFTIVDMAKGTVFTDKQLVGDLMKKVLVRCREFYNQSYNEFHVSVVTVRGGRVSNA